MLPKMAFLKENSEQFSQKSLISYEVRPLPFPSIPRVRAPNDLPRLLKTANPQTHVPDSVSKPQSR
jgi:hypothetical protein